MAIILCDIDGTLLVKIRADRPGEVSPKRAALNRALSEVLGVRDVDFSQGMEHGLTDWQISERAVRRRAPQMRIDRAAWREICARAEAVFTAPAAGDAPLYRRLPGVPHVLHALREAGHVLGLVTGNVAFFAQFKLDQADIDRALFAGPSGFGDDGRERADILRAALGQRKDRAGAPAVVVLGDTVHDLAGARAVALPFLGTGAMGLRRQEVIASDLGAGAATPAELPGTAWVSDLGDAEAVLAAIAGLAAR